MIQVGTILKVVDNTGAKNVICLKIYSGYRSRYAYFTDIVLVSVRTLRSKRRDSVKVKKGEMYKALILRVKYPKIFFNGDIIKYVDRPAVVLLNNQQKILGTRIFGSLLNKFRFTKYLKALTLSSGSHSV